jgi:hypothetical protein
MKNKAYVFSILALFCALLNLNADPVISMVIEPYPLLKDSPEAEKAMIKLKKPGRIPKLGLKSLRVNPLNKGIFSTYAGYLTMSNNDGQTLFIRKHIAPYVYLLITDKITPVMMAGNTIHHWNIEEKTDAKMYKMERLQDGNNDLFYWLTEEVPVPKDGKIPLESITILAKPKNIYVPEGITITEDSPNLTLPTIYAKKGIKTNANALYILNMRQFFGPIHSTYKTGPALNQMLIGD